MKPKMNIIVLVELDKPTYTELVERSFQFGEIRVKLRSLVVALQGYIRHTS